MKYLSPNSGTSLAPTPRPCCARPKSVRTMQHSNPSSFFRRKGARIWPLLLLAGAVLPPAGSHAQTLSSLSISPGQPTVDIGSTTQLTATAKYSNGSSTNLTSGVTWSSTDLRLVSISASGVASGKATATVSITATYQGKSATTAISSSVGNITWSAPLTITKGGTYSGNWKSTSPTVPAVTVATTAAVIIENSRLMGPNDLISDPYHSNNLTVKNVIGIGTNPNVSGQAYGIFVNAQNPVLLDVENCYFENVRFGVWVRGYAGNRNGTQTITILNNRGHNVTGVESNGKSGTLAGETNWQWAHAYQLSNVNSVPGMTIAWNELINYPNQSMVNEVINIFESSGTSSSPLEIHDNYIQGAYAYNPAVDSYNGGAFATDGSSGDTVATATAFNHVYNNQFIGTVNVGIQFSAGHDNDAYNNRVISSGLLPNGTKIPSQNVGLSLFDLYGNVAKGTMYNNNMHDNTVGWMCWASRCAWDGYRNDEWFPINNSYYSTNTSIAANPITYSAENAEYTTWLSKVSSDSKTIGPSFASTSSGSGGGSGSGATTISTTAWYNVVNTNSTLCLDAASWGHSNGTVVQQYTCGSSAANQEWQFKPTDSGYYEVLNRNASSVVGADVVMSITGGAWATADGVKTELLSYGAATNEEWMPVSLGGGAYKLIARNSSKCLDVPSSSSANALQLQQYDCNGTGAQSWVLMQK